MKLLSAIEGKNGETLTSGLLAYLLVRSPEFRRTFFELLTKVLALSPPASAPSPRAWVRSRTSSVISRTFSRKIGHVVN